MSIHIPKGNRPHAVIPRGIRLETDAIAVDTMFRIRRVVRIRTARSDDRREFRRAVERFGAFAVNLEREDGDISKPADGAIPGKRGEWPSMTYFAVDGSPEALGYLLAQTYCASAELDCPIALPRIGSGQSPKP